MRASVKRAVTECTYANEGERKREFDNYKRLEKKIN